MTESDNLSLVHAGRTMSAGELALRAKLRALSNLLLRVPTTGPGAAAYGNAGQLLSDVLTGELDPRRDEVQL
jgi:hypothetical protein